MESFRQNEDNMEGQSSCFLSRIALLFRMINLTQLRCALVDRASQKLFRKILYSCNWIYKKALSSFLCAWRHAVGQKYHTRGRKICNISLLRWYDVIWRQFLNKTKMTLFCYVLVIVFCYISSRSLYINRRQISSILTMWNFKLIGRCGRQLLRIK